MSDNLENTNFDRYAISYSQADKTVSASTWFNKSFTVLAGDIITFSLRSSATSGAFTRKLTGSVSGILVNVQDHHVNYNVANAAVVWICTVAETITIESYTNTATTFSDVAVTITRKVIH